LWLEMNEPTKIAAIDRERDEDVQGTRKVHNFSCATRSAGDEKQPDKWDGTLAIAAPFINTTTPLRFFASVIQALRSRSH
jgi:hypothetical protein